MNMKKSLIIFVALFATLASFSAITELNQAVVTNIETSAIEVKQTPLVEVQTLKSIDFSKFDESNFCKNVDTVDKYFRCLSIDENSLLALDTSSKSKLPRNSRKEEKNGVAICKYKKAGIGSDDSTGARERSQMLTTSPSHSIYPGALIRLDQELVQGKPRVIGTNLKRKPFVLAIEGLPGVSETRLNIAGSTVEETKALVDSAIKNATHSFLEEQVEGKSYQGTETESQWNFAKLHTSAQAAAELGFNFKGLSGSVEATFSHTDSKDETTVFALFTQTFFKVTYQPNPVMTELYEGLDNPSTEVLEEFVYNINSSTPPGYISKANYGQMILIRMTFKERITETKAKAKAKYIVGEIEVGGHTDITVKNTSNNVDIQIVPIGGNPSNHGQLIKANGLDEAKTVIAGATTFSKNTHASLISYVTSFLNGKNLDGKDLKDKVARVSLTSDYIIKDCTLYPYGQIQVHHHGAYTADFYVEYKIKDIKTGRVISHKHSFEGKTSGFLSPVLKIPGDAYEIKANARAHTGLVWQPFNTIFDKYYASAPVVRLKAKGTTLNTFHKEKEPNK